MVADYVGAKHAVATVNGTAALHVGLLVAGVQPNDEVLVPTLSFIAPANAVRYTGAWPVFMDADPIYWQMDAEKVKDFLEKECSWKEGLLYNKTTSRRVKAILPVHILGHPCDMDALLELARKFNLVVIEDATESLGARYKENRVGRLGDVGCLSFNGNKIITTGGGGMIVTDNEEWARRAKYLTTQAKDDEIENIHHEIGFNYRLTNLQAAMGCAQMEYLDEHVDAKRKIAQSYKNAFQNLSGFTSMSEAPWVFSTFWLYTVLINETEYGMNSRNLFMRFAESGIQTRPLWQPLHRSKVFEKSQSYKIEKADTFYRDALSLPSSVGLCESDLNLVSGVVKRCLAE